MSTHQTQVDHLVVVAASLDEGVAWCEATLGITPGPGGTHPLMGTHNRLFKIATPHFPDAYFEIIAIDPAATPTRAPGLRRWFDMDDANLRSLVSRNGPRLCHWVARTHDMAAGISALAAIGLDRGRVLAASRMTPAGLVEWQISVRDDGARLFDGCLPTLIQWGKPDAGPVIHPASTMPESGVTLQGLQVRHPQADALRLALRTIGMGTVQVETGPARLSVHLQTPKGPLELTS